MPRSPRTTTILITSALSLLTAPALVRGFAPFSPILNLQQATDQRVWDFEQDIPGSSAKGVAGLVGQWAVAEEGKNRVLAQLARNEDDTFNLALMERTNARDLDLSVRLKAVSGKNDQGGGLVWRARDARNYYIARYNPLEDNFRVYRVEDGKRTMFENAKVPGDQEWHTLRVTMVGPAITCYLDGRKWLEVRDGTFSEAGQIGLWSKSDAQTYFDDLTLRP